MLVPKGREKAVLVSEIVGAVTDVLLNMLLIPRYEAAGAAMGTLAAEFMVLFIQYLALRREIDSLLKRLPLKKAVGALGVAFLSSICVKRIFSDWNVFLLLIISAGTFWGIYGGSLILLKERFTVGILRQFVEGMKKKIN